VLGGGDVNKIRFKSVPELCHDMLQMQTIITVKMGGGIMSFLFYIEVEVIF
jgi:hypothetical protein